VGGEEVLQNRRARCHKEVSQLKDLRSDHPLLTQMAEPTHQFFNSIPMLAPFNSIEVKMERATG